MLDPREVDPRLDPAPSFGEAERRRWLRLVAEGRTRAAAAREIGVDYGVVVRAVGSDSHLREGLALAEGEKWELAEAGLFTALEEGQPWAIKLVVKEGEGLRERWRPAASEVDVSVEVGPGVERVAALAARLEARRLEEGGNAEPPPLRAGVLDVDSVEVGGLSAPEADQGEDDGR